MSFPAAVEKAVTVNAPSSGERIDYLDGWRGLAIALVLVAHFAPVEGFDSGRLGVDLFFCLSGILMAKILFTNQTPLLTFYERRFSRVIPAFLLYLFTMYLVAYFLGNPVPLAEMCSTLTFCRTYYPLVPNIWEASAPIGHLWSLNVEEHSYVLMSVLTLYTVRKREWVPLLVIGLAAVLVAVFYMKRPQLAPYLFSLRTECAASFIFISAGYSLVKHKISRYVPPWLPLLSFLLACSCYCAFFPFWWAKMLLTPFLVAFTANHLSQLPSVAMSCLSFRPLRLLGIWSYSIYLWQQPFYRLKDTMHPLMPLLLALTAGVCSFYFYEQPVREWINERRYLSAKKLPRPSRATES